MGIEGIIAEELKRHGWKEAQQRQRRKSDPVKLALAARLRRETILTVGWIARRLEMGDQEEHCQQATPLGQATGMQRQPSG